MGKGPIWKRAVYSASRVLITPDYHGHNTINASELLGRGIAQGISTIYYPSQDRTLSEIATKWDTPSCVTPSRTPSASSGPISRCMFCIAIHRPGALILYRDAVFSKLTFRDAVN
jgi:hypothetical protein